MGRVEDKIRLVVQQQLKIFVWFHRREEYSFGICRNLL
jgi:hypothetical protein